MSARTLGSFAPVLHVEVIAAKKLDVGPDSESLPSCYVLVSYNSKVKSTEVATNSQRPVWRVGSHKSEFTFRVSPVEKQVKIVVMDYSGSEGLSADRIIGTATFDIKPLEDGKLVESWFDLEPPLNVGNFLLRLADKKSQPVEVGKIHLSMFVTRQRVTIDKSPLWTAIKEKSVSTVKDILKAISFRELNEVDDYGENVIHAAVARKDWDPKSNDILMVLLEDERVDVNHPNADKNTPFHYFCQKYNGPHVIGLLDRFCERGADIHAKNRYGETPLHKAMFNPSLKMTLVDLLLQRGADPNEGSSTGETPLHYAVRWGRDDVVRFLIQKGADFDAKSNDGSTPFSISQQESPAIAELIKDSKDIIKWLQRSGLSDYIEDFIAGDVFLYTLPEINEQYLLRLLPEGSNHQKVLSAVKRFTMEVGSFKPKLQEQQKKEKFLKQLELRRKESVLRRSLNQQVLNRLSVDNTPPPRDGLGDAAQSSAARLVTQDSVALLRKKKTPHQTLRIKLDKNKIEAEAQRVMRQGSQVGDSIFERIAGANALARERSSSSSSSPSPVREATRNAEALVGSPSRAASLSASPRRDGSISPGRRPLTQTESTVASASATISAALAATANPVAVGSSLSVSSSSSAELQPVSWEIDPLDLSYVRVLGRGGSGEVWLARYRGEDVAVKILHQTASDSEIAEFKKEFQVLISLASPYVIKFFGAVVQRKRALVMEFCSRGSLFDVMRSNSDLLTWQLFFRMAIDTARGLAHLHALKPEILHRDLKSLNLLVTDDYHVKLCDFGLSRLNTASNLATLTRCRGTFAYVAPEVYDCEPFTPKSDVYALAIVLWELTKRVLTGEYQRPYKEFPFIKMDFQTLVMARKRHLRPTIPEGTPTKLAQLIQACWDPLPDNRLDAHTVLEALEELHEDYRNKPRKWDKLIVQYALSRSTDGASASSRDEADPGLTLSQSMITSSSSTMKTSKGPITAHLRSRRDSIWRHVVLRDRQGKASPPPVGAAAPAVPSLNTASVRRDSAPPLLEKQDLKAESSSGRSSPAKSPRAKRVGSVQVTAPRPRSASTEPGDSPRSGSGSSSPRTPLSSSPNV